MEKVFVTKQGLRKLKEELGELKTVRRKEIANRIEEAKEYGDISENAEYEDAKNEQAFVESRICELEMIIRNSSLLSANRNHSVIGYDSRVKVKIGKATLDFRIVGMAESDPTKGLISCNSPIGRALIGLARGDEATVIAPQRTLKYKVLKVE
jgi:transcription elongation factor GreA